MFLETSRLPKNIRVTVQRCYPHLKESEVDIMPRMNKVESNVQETVETVETTETVEVVKENKKKWSR